MTKIINGITYDKRHESEAKLIKIPVEGETPLPESQALINARSYPLSVRNGANAYILPTDKEKLYLNFIAQKIHVDDQSINEIIQPQFEYFVEEVIPGVEPFVLPDGLIFRCVSANSLPKNKEDYEYWIVMEGQKRRIPDYRTLEVMLAERDQNLLSVRVVEENQCADIPTGAPIQSKAASWKEDFKDLTSLETLQEMENNAKEATAIAESAKAEAASQIAAVKAEAEAAKAEAEAAKAEAEAAAAASAAAIAQAEAAKAEAEAAKAEAEAGT